jgi:putative FmdB family regulatory protein
MPIYEFSCSTCDRSFEELVRSAESVSEVVCPTCGGRHVKRKISLFASKANTAGAFASASSASGASCSTGST